ncbi:MAG TPA: Ig-like domain-containing protein, partial [bacterium]|nr:Ig-like domain-containing protein [bacterium]
MPDPDPDDITPPEVASTTPEDLSADALPVQEITATFSKEMNPLTITEDSFFVTGEGGADVPGTISLSDENTKAVFTPKASFKVGRRYVATITAQAADAGGLTLDGDHSWSFSSAGSFFVVMTDTHLRLPGFPDDADYDNAGNVANLENAV